MSEAGRWCADVDGDEPAGVALAAADFPAGAFDDLALAEESHFWFRARNRLITDALDRWFPRLSSFLEIGCGTGHVLRAVAGARPGLRLLGAEPLSEGLGWARRRLPAATFVRCDARRLPLRGSIGAVGLFDVLEHIRRDGQVLRGIHDALEPGGGLLVTVPQHAWLWSDFDRLTGHKRRYSRAGLRRRIETAGFEVLHLRSFVSLLLPVLAARRVFARSVVDSDPAAELRPGRLANRFGAAAMALERGLARRGVTLPWGASLLLVARKPGDPSAASGDEPG